MTHPFATQVEPTISDAHQVSTEDGAARLNVFFDRMLRPFTPWLLAAAEASPGLHVLDAGCGTGRLARSLAAAVRPGGTVLGVDISPAAIATAQTQSATFVEENVMFTAADAARLDRPAGSFDLVVSEFAAMLYDDLVAAHTHLCSLLHPGGRYVATVWQSPDRNEWHAAPLRAVQAWLDIGPDGTGEERGPFALADPARIGDVLTAAGFVEVTVKSIECIVPVGYDLDEAIEFFNADMRESLRTLTNESTIDRIAATLRADLAARTTVSGVLVPAAAWLIAARAPTTGGAR